MDSCSRMSTAALFTFFSIIHTAAETWMQSKCPLTSEWMDKGNVFYTHHVILFSLKY